MEGGEVPGEVKAVEVEAEQVEDVKSLNSPHTSSDNFKNLKPDEPELEKNSRPSVIGSLLWKNFTLKRKRWKSSCCEVLAPLIFIILVVLLKSLTKKAVVPDGWSEERADFCPYTGEEAESQLVKVVCPLPFNNYFRDPGDFLELAQYVSGNNPEHPFAKIFFIHENQPREMAAVDMFIEWLETVGIAETGPLAGFSNSTVIYGDGTTKAFEDYARSREYGDPFGPTSPEIAAGVKFTEIDFENAIFRYSLRFNLSFTGGSETFTAPSTLLPPVDNLQKQIKFDLVSESGLYVRRGFVAMQQVIDSFFIAKSGEFYTRYPIKTGENVTAERRFFEPANINFVAFPVHAYDRDIFFSLVRDIFPLIFLVAFLSPVSQIVSVIVLEKEVRAREMMKLMGVPDYLIILSWYITYLGYFLILGIIIALMGGTLFPATTASAGGFSFLIVGVFLLFGMATTAFCFVVSTFFRKAFNATVAALMLFVILFFTYYSFDNLSSLPTLCLLIPQVCFAFMIKTIAAFEESGVGIAGDLVFLTIDGFNVGMGLFFFIFDFLYLTALGFYLNATVPGEYGSPLPFYFICSPYYYKRVYHDILAKRKLRREQFSRDKFNEVMKGPEKLKRSGLTLVSGPTFEAVETNLAHQLGDGVGIQIRGLTKVFSTPDGDNTAVDHLDLDVFEGQILVLLGHNGAGKTTTLQILSGMLPPSQGDAFIYGKKISTDMAVIREDLGFCPQHDVLYHELTVYDHLKFYGSIKGLRGKALQAAITKGIDEVGLTDKRNVRSRDLSGGMKRKLSLAISLIGNSRVIFVDEPTSGVDPWSRRSMWEVLQNCRKGRVIILTTHFMDEADLLGDRIAIMAEGKLQCVGSSLFLKQLYGAGYQLTFVKKPSCQSESVEEVVTKFVAEAKTVSDVGTELTFHLPLKRSSQFAVLFKELDDLIEADGLAVQGYGISVTTMEEVFLKAGQSEDLLHGALEVNRQKSDRNVREIKHYIPDTKQGNSSKDTPISWTGKRLRRVKTAASGILDTLLGKEAVFLPQLAALFMKRIHYAKRDSYSFVCNTLVPVTIFCLGLVVLKYAPILQDNPELIFSVDDWNPSYHSPYEKAFLPSLEFSRTQQLAFGTGRILKQNNFPQFTLQNYIPNATGYPEQNETLTREVFSRTYENGYPTECTQFFRCDTDYPGVVGESILDIGDALIYPDDELQKVSIEDRNGALLYASAVVVPQPAKLENGRCFFATINVDTQQGSVNAIYDTVLCSDRNSDCLMIEATLSGLTNCLPAGCVSDLEGNALIQQAIQNALSTGSIPTVDEIYATLNATGTTFFQCEGNLCNSGPANILGDNICRGNPAGSGLPASNPTCIANHLDLLDLTFDISFDDQNGNNVLDTDEVNTAEIHISTAVDTNANYCNDRFNGGSGDERDPLDGFNISTSGRVCFDWGGTQQLASLLPLIDLVSGGTGTNLSVGSSYDFQNNECVDENLSCELAVLPLGGANICVADTCVQNLSSVLEDLFGTALTPAVEGLIINSSNVPCSERLPLCNATADLVTLRDLVIIAGETDILSLISNSDVLSLLFATGTTVPASGTRLLQASNGVCQNCSISSFGSICLNVTCGNNLDGITGELFGPIFGPILVQVIDAAPSVDCDDNAGIATLNCSEVTDLETLDASQLNDIVVNFANDFVNGLNQTQIDNVLAAIIDIISFIQTGQNVTLDDLLSLVNGIPGFEDVSVEDLITFLNNVQNLLLLLQQAQDNPDVLIAFILDSLNNIDNVPAVCTNPADSCLLAQVDLSATGLGILCFPTGCSDEGLPLSATENLTVTEDTVTLLADATSSQLTFFSCNSTLCNFGCYQPSNCEADELTPVKRNISNDFFIDYFDFPEACLVLPSIRLSYLVMINTTATHVVPITVNELHTAFLRRSLAEYILYNNNANSSADDRLGEFEGGIYGNADTTFLFDESTAPKITVSSHPLPTTSKIREIVQAIIAFTSSIFCVLAFAFIPGPMISYVVMEKEEEVQVKHLQFVSGASIPAYWLANYLFDFTSYMVPFILSLVLIIAFNIESFIANGALGAVAIVFLGYGFAVIPFSYLFGHYFSKHTTALIWIIIINCMTGLTLMIASFAMDQIPQTEDINPKLKWLYRIFPGFCLGDSLLQIATTSLIIGFLGDAFDAPSLYDLDVAGANIMYLFIEGVLFISVVIGIEVAKTHPGLMQRFYSFYYRRKEEKLETEGSRTSSREEVDVDVLAEARRVEKEVQNDSVGSADLEAQEDVVRIVHLRKVYPGGKIAVHDLSLGIPEGECFGYLGINGAGKTTTLKCLTGDIFPTAGSGTIKGFNIVTEQVSVRKNVGYCSQFSSILGLLTVREHLELFSRIKRVDNVAETVQSLLLRLSLKPFENKLAKALSGGNKRKLSVAIAMIGSPSVMLLDEPSTGMDVASRRFMWDVIENMSLGKYDGKRTSVILTTHSMEECEALCSRVGIMVGGKLKCLGSVQHLKSRFGSGFTVEAKLKFVPTSEIEEIVKARGIMSTVTPSYVKKMCQNMGNSAIFDEMTANKTGFASVIIQRLSTYGSIPGPFFVEWFIQNERIKMLTNFLRNNFTDVEVTEAHEQKLRFSIAKSEKTRLSSLFDAMEQNKEALHISEYAVSQTTLEQIFNDFASEQLQEGASAASLHGLTPKKKNINAPIIQGDQIIKASL